MLLGNGRVRALLSSVAFVAGIAGVHPAGAATYFFQGGNFQGGVSAPSPLLEGDELYLLGRAATVFKTNYVNRSGKIILEGNSILIDETKILENQGEFEIQSGSVAIRSSKTGGVSVFNNTGTIRYLGSFFDISSHFFNSGTIDVENVNGRIRISGPNIAFGNGTVMKGAGRVDVTSSATFQGAVSASNLSVSESLITGRPDFVFSGNLRTNNVAFTGSATIAKNATVIFEGSSSTGVEFRSTSFINNGTATWSSGFLRVAPGSVVTNNGQWYLNSSGAVTIGGRFVNAATGTLGRTVAGTVTLGSLENSGAIQVDAGTIALLSLTSGAGASYAGAGATTVTGAATFIGGFTSGNLTLASGTFTGQDARLNGALFYNGGTLAGGWTIEPGATLSMLGRTITATLTNKGTVALGAAAVLNGGGTLTNKGLIRTTAANTGFQSGSGGGTLVNAADGEIAAQQTMVIRSTFRNEGGKLTAAGGNILFNGGSIGAGAPAFLDGTRFVGASNGRGGSYASVIDGGATFAGGIAVSGQGLTLASGVFTGEDARLSGDVAWSGGALAGTWTVGSGTLRLISGSYHDIDGATVRNEGTIAVGANELLLLNGGSLRNALGTIELADGSSIANGGSAGAFVNDLSIRKLSGGGTATIGNGLGFVNSGSIEVGSGVIRLPDNFVDQGTLLGSGAFAAAGTLTAGAAVSPGGSSLGTLTIDADYAQQRFTRLNIQLGTGRLSDLLAVTGAARLDGILALSCLSCSWTGNQEFKVVAATGGISGSFATIDASALGLPKDYAVRIRYDYTDGNAFAFVYRAIFGVPEPSTWAMMIAGFGLVGGTLRRDRRRLRAV